MEYHYNLIDILRAVKYIFLIYLVIYIKYYISKIVLFSFIKQISYQENKSRAKPSI